VRRLAIVIAGIAAALVSAAVATGSGPSPSAGVQITPVLRVPFPDRKYLVDLPKEAAVHASAVQLTENGIGIGDFAFAPLSTSGLRFGAVLAVDSSDSMSGAPFAGALAAARNFVAHSGASEQVGILTFNSRIHVLHTPTVAKADLERVLARPQAVAFGTHIYDAVDAALAVLRSAKVSSGVIVLLSDGSDVGSTATLAAAITRASRQHVRVFTVGLRSGAYDPKTLRSLAGGTGGSYAEAASPSQLASIYDALSTRLASEYVLEYRSLAPPKTRVDVQVSITGFGSGAASYTAPTPAGLPPFQRSFATRFLLSTYSLLVLALLVAGLVVYVVQKVLTRARSRVVERVTAFVAPGTPARPATDWRERSRGAAVAGSRKAQGVLAGLERRLEIADIKMSAASIVGLTVVATLLVVIVLALISPVLAVLGLGTPLVSRALVRRKLKQVRNLFAEQLPANLQVLASALRAGHSFVGALASVVEQADEPSRRELRRAISDEQLGVPIDEAIRRVAARMRSRDLDQVALVAELQRTTGGNAAEVLDVVVGTIRDRQEIRRLIKTLTAQGRMARWILTLLPIVTGLAFYAIQPHVAGPFYTKTVGQFALLIAAIAVICGSLLIQRVIEIEV
jgi:tight adherence protein B